MTKVGGLSAKAKELLKTWQANLNLSSQTKYFLIAELAGFVQSAARFSLEKMVENEDNNITVGGVISVLDMEQALIDV